MYTKPDHTVDSQILKSCLVFLSLLNTALNPWLYSRLNESLKKTKENCTDKCCQMLSCFKCNCLLNTRVDHQPFSASDRQNNTYVCQNNNFSSNLKTVNNENIYPVLRRYQDDNDVKFNPKTKLLCKLAMEKL